MMKLSLWNRIRLWWHSRVMGRKVAVFGKGKPREKIIVFK